MTSIQFARLSDTALRDAWPNEAQDFTPWLYGNMDYLSEALGLELEAIDIEAAVDSFSADIIARDAETKERVLIENQLESSDHKHLGQILTYLAGIEAKCVVWVARSFHEAHCSAIRWLNEHTDDGFKFFAVRLRVVKIGDSALAPVFEVIEQPNNWERELGSKTKAADSELGNLKLRFWRRYVDMFPNSIIPSRATSIWIPMFSDETVFLSLFVAQASCGMYIRGPRGTDCQDLESLMLKYKDILESNFGENQSKVSGKYYNSSHKIDLRDERCWDEAIHWMEKQRQRYFDVFEKMQETK